MRALDLTRIDKGSKTRTTVLALFFSDPEKEYYLRQLEKLVGYSAANIRREMVRLETEGLFLSRNIGKLKLYKLNKEYPIYDELKGIIRKTVGVEGGLRALLTRVKGIGFAFIYGSFAEGNEGSLSDIDIIVIGGIKPMEIKPLFYEYQSKIGREVNSIVYSREDFLSRLKDKNHFVSSIVNVKKIFLKGNESEFRKFIQIREARKA